MIPNNIMSKTHKQKKELEKDNTILCELKNNKYVFIRVCVYEFTTDKPIT